ncbi:MAG: aromatic ring-hydroxylating dioxygenase subunit alpha [Elusimicrobia bacterium]|nr:aromatic ring-hydroxylating dioxygenase subunit alpha [Elusimicrobiota bacterium]
MDLRTVGSHPDYWYPVAFGRDLGLGRTLAASFAGGPIALFRAPDGLPFALEDRCAHRQVPLSEGVVCGQTVRCGYHGWTYGSDGRCIDVPYLSKDHARPNGVRRYPCREAYGLLWVFPGEAARAANVPFPDLPSHGNPGYKTRYLSRRLRCHYTFLHENLMDMNHQFLHRRFMGAVQATLLGADRGPDWLEARYTFSRVSGSQSLGEKFMLGRRAASAKLREHDTMTIRTQYPYQTLTFCRADQELPALDLWLAYSPVDARQRVTHSYGLMMIRRPAVPGLIHLFWPFIVLFTEGIFSQDQRIMEQEQQAFDAQGRDLNQEVFPVIRELRELLARLGVPLG